MADDAATFEQALERDGFREIDTKSAAPKEWNEAHSHPFEVRGLMLDGEFAIECDGEERRYHPGEVFTMRPGRAHRERVGAGGARYLVGRRYPAA